jgi:hypothetical protein
MVMTAAVLRGSASVLKHQPLLHCLQKNSHSCQNVTGKLNSSIYSM